jgi:hypothetical protein
MQILGSPELTGRRLVLLQAPASGMQVQIRKRGVWKLLQVGNEITKQDIESGSVRCVQTLTLILNSINIIWYFFFLRLMHTSGGSVFPLRFRVEDVNGQHSKNLVMMKAITQLI